MTVPSISFVMVDARRRVARVEELKAAGIADVEHYLASQPDETARLRDSAVILDCNETAVRTFGGQVRADLIGQPTHRFFDPLCTALRNAVRAYAAGQGAFQQQARSIRLDGTHFDTIFCLVPRAMGTDPGIWLAAFVDITEHVRQRQAMDALKDELAHVARVSLLGEMSGSIAHEIGQPLSAITMESFSAARLLQRDEIDLDKLRALHQRIAGQAGRAVGIIDRVRAMVTHRTPAAEPASVHDLLVDAVQFVRHELDLAGIGLSMRRETNDDVVCVDRIQLQQVLVNIMMNAVQMLRQHAVAEPKVAIAIERDEESLRIVLEDNGPGIATNHMDRLFDGFFTTRTDGLGLGLNICRTIVENHGGVITAGNRPEGGAVFTVALPVVRA